jgi:hypothetical protein
LVPNTAMHRIVSRSGTDTRARACSPWRYCSRAMAWVSARADRSQRSGRGRAAPNEDLGQAGGEPADGVGMANVGEEPVMRACATRRLDGHDNGTRPAGIGAGSPSSSVMSLRAATRSS